MTWLTPDFVWETPLDEALVGDPFDPEAPYVPLNPRKTFRALTTPDRSASTAEPKPCPSAPSSASRRAGTAVLENESRPACAPSGS